MKIQISLKNIMKKNNKLKFLPIINFSAILLLNFFSFISINLLTLDANLFIQYFVLLFQFSIRKFQLLNQPPLLSTKHFVVLLFPLKTKVAMLF